MSKKNEVEIIYPEDEHKFFVCCTLLVKQTQHQPTFLAELLRRGIHHFRLSKANGMVDISAVPNPDAKSDSLKH